MLCNGYSAQSFCDPKYVNVAVVGSIFRRRIYLGACAGRPATPGQGAWTLPRKVHPVRPFHSGLSSQQRGPLGRGPVAGESDPPPIHRDDNPQKREPEPIAVTGAASHNTMYHVSRIRTSVSTPVWQLSQSVRCAQAL
jgi:hypothetical protein